FRLRADRGDPGIRIDLVAAVLIGVAIVLLTLGFNNLNAWGVFTATVAAPFTLVGVSPAPVLIVLGVVCGPVFFWWTRRRAAPGRPPLVALALLHEGTGRAGGSALSIGVAPVAALASPVP